MAIGVLDNKKPITTSNTVNSMRKLEENVLKREIERETKQVMESFAGKSLCRIKENLQSSG